MGSYFRLIPREHSSGGRQKLGPISKQGSSFLRFLLVEAGQSAARYDPELGRFYRPPGSAQTSRAGQGGGGAQAGDEVVPDVARGLELRATMQGRVQASLSHSVAGTFGRPVE